MLPRHRKDAFADALQRADSHTFEAPCQMQHVHAHFFQLEKKTRKQKNRNSIARLFFLTPVLNLARFNQRIC